MRPVSCNFHNGEILSILKSLMDFGLKRGTWYIVVCSFHFCSTQTLLVDMIPARLVFILRRCSQNDSLKLAKERKQLAAGL